MKRLVALVLTVIFLSVVTSNLLNITTKTKITQPPNVTNITFTLPTLPELKPTNVSYQTAAIKVPAVDEKGNGVVTWLRVSGMPGEGRVLVNINQLLFWVDTQYSIRVAKIVAENITGKDLSDVDLIYSIETNASLIEGQSAGAALTIVTVAVLENRTIDPDVMITGTIGLDGSVGPVGAIVAKATASKQVGASLFLVPVGQGSQTYYEPHQSCEEIGPFTYCTTEYKPKRVDVSADVGIEVREVATIQEALKYFLT